MKYTLSKHAIDVTTARNISLEWIIRTIESPSLKVVVADNEIIFYTVISENEKRCLKVVVNPLNLIVVTAYFDRNMRKKGCQ